MFKMLTNYAQQWYTLMVRPIYFYTLLEEESWKEGAFTFLLITSWLLALAGAITIFIIQFIPIGATLVAGIAGFKFIIILPVLMALGGSFFLITFLILGVLLVLALLALMAGVAWVLHYVYYYLKGKGSVNYILQASLYSSAVFMVGTLIFILMILSRYGILSFGLFRVGYNLVYGFIVIYSYGLWAIAGRKIYKISKPKAFMGAIVPILVLLLFGILFDKIGLPKLHPWIS